MPSALRLDSAWLAGLAVESVFYGIFVVLFTDTIRVLVGRLRQRKDTTTALLFVTGLILFMCMTAHWAIDLSRAFDAFIYSQDSSQSSSPQAGQTPADLFYSYTATKKYVATSGLYVITKATGDAFMIYRLYVVWNRSIWIVAFPALVEVTLLVTGGIITWELSRPHGTVFDIDRVWITAFFSSSFIVTGFCAILIAYRVWLGNRSLSNVGITNMGTMKIVQVIIQSAALNSASSLISLGLYTTGSNGEFVAVGLDCQITGIIFAMIVTRPNKLRELDSLSHSREFPRQGIQDPSSYPMRPMPVAIRITTERSEARGEPDLEAPDSKAEMYDTSGYSQNSIIGP